MLRRLLCLLWLCAGGLAAVARESALPPGIYDRVAVGEAKTSIYIGSVTMEMPDFRREDGRFVATYRAKVFPYFFYNESGRIAIDLDDAQLARLAHGTPIDFAGQAVRDDGTVRVVKGRAVPADAVSGRLKVSVFVTRHVELIFHPTYRFVGP